MEYARAMVYLRPDLEAGVDYHTPAPTELQWLNDSVQPTIEELEAAYPIQKEIDEITNLEREAVYTRQKWLTAEMMPEGVLKDRKLAKYETYWVELLTEYTIRTSTLIATHGDAIIDKL